MSTMSVPFAGRHYFGGVEVMVVEHCVVLRHQLPSQSVPDHDHTRVRQNSGEIEKFAMHEDSYVLNSFIYLS